MATIIFIEHILALTSLIENPENIERDNLHSFDCLLVVAQKQAEHIYRRGSVVSNLLHRDLITQRGLGKILLIEHYSSQTTLIRDVISVIFKKICLTFEVSNWPAMDILAERIREDDCA